jgi:hypothetical protein
MGIFQELGISQDRNGFNAFNELENAEKKFADVLERIIGEDILVQDLGSDIDFGVATDISGIRVDEEEKFLSSLPLNLSREGTDFEDDQKYIRSELSPSEFNNALNMLKSENQSEPESSPKPKSSESNKSMGTENNNMIQNIIQTARENKVLLAGAGAVAILVIN